MPWILPAQTAALTATLILSLVYYYLYKQDKRLFLLFWFISWLFYSIRFLVGIISQIYGNTYFLDLFYYFFTLLSGYMLILGCYHFINKKIPVIWTYFLGILVLWNSFALFYGLNNFYVTAPVFFFMAIIYFITGIILILSKYLDQFGKILSGVVFILWGLHKADYPFLRSVDSFAPWGYLIGAVFDIIAALGMILIYFYQIRHELFEEREKFRFLAENTTDVIASIDINEKLLYMSPSCIKLTGFTPQESINQPIEEIMPKDYWDITRQRMLLITQKINQGKKENLSEKYELQLYHKSNKLIWVEVILDPVINSKNEIDYFVLVSRNIDQRKKTEAQLNASIHEKDILLQEIHHRVKNNMQVILGLLDIQFNQIQDKEIKSQFLQTQNRIRSMAMVHEILYQSRDFSNINFSTYIQIIIDQVFSSYPFDPKKISLETQVENIFLDIDRTIACGLIVNELMTNIFKYAFPESFTKKGKVLFIFRKKDNQMIEMIASDNGVGMSEKVDTGKSSSLGLKLIPMLVKQIKGTINIDKTNGTAVKIEFPI